MNTSKIQFGTSFNLVEPNNLLSSPVSAVPISAKDATPNFQGYLAAGGFATAHGTAYYPKKDNVGSSIANIFINDHRRLSTPLSIDNEQNHDEIGSRIVQSPNIQHGARLSIDRDQVPLRYSSDSFVLNSEKNRKSTSIIVPSQSPNEPDGSRRRISLSSSNPLPRLQHAFADDAATPQRHSVNDSVPSRTESVLETLSKQQQQLQKMQQQLQQQLQDAKYPTLPSNSAPPLPNQTILMNLLHSPAAPVHTRSYSHSGTPGAPSAVLLTPTVAGNQQAGVPGIYVHGSSLYPPHTPVYRTMDRDSMYYVVQKTAAQPMAQQAAPQASPAAPTLLQLSATALTPSPAPAPAPTPAASAIPTPAPADALLVSATRSSGSVLYDVDLPPPHMHSHVQSTPHSTPHHTRTASQSTNLTVSARAATQGGPSVQEFVRTLHAAAGAAAASMSSASTVVYDLDASRTDLNRTRHALDDSKYEENAIFWDTPPRNRSPSARATSPPRTSTRSLRAISSPPPPLPQLPASSPTSTSTSMIAAVPKAVATPALASEQRPRSHRQSLLVQERELRRMAEDLIADAWTGGSGSGGGSGVSGTNKSESGVDKTYLQRLKKISKYLPATFRSKSKSSQETPTNHSSSPTQTMYSNPFLDQTKHTSRSRIARPDMRMEQLEDDWDRPGSSRGAVSGAEVDVGASGQKKVHARNVEYYYNRAASSRTGGALSPKSPKRLQRSLHSPSPTPLVPPLSPPLSAPMPPPSQLLSAPLGTPSAASAPSLSAPSPSAAAAATTTRYAESLYPFQGLDSQKELSFPAGTRLLVFQHARNDWWFGALATNPKAQGWFPRAYVQLIPGTTTGNATPSAGRPQSMQDLSLSPIPHVGPADVLSPNGGKRHRGYADEDGPLDEDLTIATPNGATSAGNTASSSYQGMLDGLRTPPPPGASEGGGDGIAGATSYGRVRASSEKKRSRVSVTKRQAQDTINAAWSFADAGTPGQGGSADGASAGMQAVRSSKKSSQKTDKKGDSRVKDEKKRKKERKHLSSTALHPLTLFEYSDSDVSVDVVPKKRGGYLPSDQGKGRQSTSKDALYDSYGVLSGADFLLRPSKRASRRRKNEEDLADFGSEGESDRDAEALALYGVGARSSSKRTSSKRYRKETTEAEEDLAQYLLKVIAESQKGSKRRSKKKRIHREDAMSESDAVDSEELDSDVGSPARGSSKRKSKRGSSSCQRAASSDVSGADSEWDSDATEGEEVTGRRSGQSSRHKSRGGITSMLRRGKRAADGGSDEGSGDEIETDLEEPVDRAEILAESIANVFHFPNSTLSDTDLEFGSAETEVARDEDGDAIFHGFTSDLSNDDGQGTGSGKRGRRRAAGKASGKGSAGQGGRDHGAEDKGKSSDSEDSLLMGYTPLLFRPDTMEEHSDSAEAQDATGSGMEGQGEDEASQRAYEDPAEGGASRSARMEPLEGEEHQQSKDFDTTNTGEGADTEAADPDAAANTSETPGSPYDILIQHFGGAADPTPIKKTLDKLDSNVRDAVLGWLTSIAPPTPGGNNPAASPTPGTPGVGARNTLASGQFNELFADSDLSPRNYQIPSTDLPPYSPFSPFSPLPARALFPAGIGGGDGTVPQDKIVNITQMADGSRVKVVSLTAEELFLHFYTPIAGAGILFRFIRASILQRRVEKLRALTIFTNYFRQTLEHRRLAKLFTLGMCANAVVERKRSRCNTMAFALGACVMEGRERVLRKHRDKFFLLGLGVCAVKQRRRRELLARRAGGVAIASAASGSGGTGAPAHTGPRTRTIAWEGMSEESVKGTIWDRSRTLTDDGSGLKGDGALGDSVVQEVDKAVDGLFENLIDTFSTEVKKKPDPKAEEAAKKLANRSALVSVLDAGLSRNLGIALTSIISKTTHEEYKQAMLALDVVKLGGIEKVSVLINNSNLWNAEGLAPLLRFNGDINTLVRHERFIKDVIYAVPGARIRFCVVEFEHNLHSTVDNCIFALQLLQNSVTEVMSSRKFACLLLDVILPLGNRLNQRGNRQQKSAAGFRIGGLNKLVQTRSSNGETFLQFVIAGLMEASPRLLSLREDFPSLMQVKQSGVSREGILLDIQRLEAGLKHVENLQAILKNQGDTSLGERLDLLIEKADGDINDLKSTWEAVNGRFTELCLWFGEEPSQTSPEWLFGNVESFVLAIEKDIKVISERHEQQMKREERRKRAEQKQSEKQKLQPEDAAASPGKQSKSPGSLTSPKSPGEAGKTRTSVSTTASDKKPTSPGAPTATSAAAATPPPPPPVPAGATAAMRREDLLDPTSPSVVPSTPGAPVTPVPPAASATAAAFRNLQLPSNLDAATSPAHTLSPTAASLSNQGPLTSRESVRASRAFTASALAQIRAEAERMEVSALSLQHSSPGGLHGASSSPSRSSLALHATHPNLPRSPLNPNRGAAGPSDATAASNSGPQTPLSPHMPSLSASPDGPTLSPSIEEDEEEDEFTSTAPTARPISMRMPMSRTQIPSARLPSNSVLAAGGAVISAALEEGSRRRNSVRIQSLSEMLASSVQPTGLAPTVASLSSGGRSGGIANANMRSGRNDAIMEVDENDSDDSEAEIERSFHLAKISLLSASQHSKEQASSPVTVHNKPGTHPQPLAPAPTPPTKKPSTPIPPPARTPATSVASGSAAKPHSPPPPTPTSAAPAAPATPPNNRNNNAQSPPPAPPTAATPVPPPPRSGDKGSPLWKTLRNKVMGGGISKKEDSTSPSNKDTSENAVSPTADVGHHALAPPPGFTPVNLPIGARESGIRPVSTAMSPISPIPPQPNFSTPPRAQGAPKPSPKPAGSPPPPGQGGLPFILGKKPPKKNQ